MSTLLLQVDNMDTKNESDSQRIFHGGLLNRRKDEGREIFLSRGEGKTTCVQEMERETER